MNVLIIDDSDDKISALTKEVVEWSPASVVSIAKSFQSGIKQLRSLKPDIVLLDMTLPTSEFPDGRASGRKRFLGGKELLAEMEFEELESKVIICTQFDTFPGPSGSISLNSLVTQLSQDHPGLVTGGLFFSHVDTSWRNKLRQLLGEIV